MKRLVAISAHLLGAASALNPFSAGLLPSTAQQECFLHYSLTRAATATPAAPVMLWIQGGPGLSAQIGNFFEIGNEQIDAKTGDLIARPEARRWSEFAHMLFLDAPEGSGFSYCVSSASLPRSSEEVAVHVRFALEEFFSRFEDLAQSKLILAGEDYAGHILPPLAAHLAKHPLKNAQLAGLMIGNGHTHPVSQVLTRPESAKYFGLVEGDCYNDAYGFATAASFLAAIGRFDASFDMRSKLEATVKQCAQGVNLNDVRTTEDYEAEIRRTLDAFMNSEHGKQLMGVAGTERSFQTHNPEVILTMKSDVMRSVASHVAQVLDADIPVLLYQGLFDWIDGVFSNEQWILDLEWRGQARYNRVERTSWTNGDGNIVGFRREYGPLAQVTIRNAGHSVPLTQPDVAFVLAKDFVDKVRKRDRPTKVV